jgi:hypothetical protein
LFFVKDNSERDRNSFGVYFIDSTKKNNVGESTNNRINLILNLNLAGAARAVRR